MGFRPRGPFPAANENRIIRNGDKKQKNFFLVCLKIILMIKNRKMSRMFFIKRSGQLFFLQSLGKLMPWDTN